MGKGVIDLRWMFTRSPPANGKPIKVKCWEHLDDTASLAIYPDGIYCFGCRFHIQNINKALDYLVKATGQPYVYNGTNEEISKKPGREKEVAGYLPAALADLYHQNLYATRKERLNWLYERTLTDETIERFFLGHDGMKFTIPVFDRSGRLISIRFRRDDFFDEEGPKYSGITGRNRPFLYPEQLQSDQREWRVVTESELCSCLLWQHDIPSVTITNGAGQLHKIIELLRPYDHITELFIASDMDKAGLEARDSYQTTSYIVKPILWGKELGKDVTELFQRGVGQSIFGYFKNKKRLRFVE